MTEDVETMVYVVDDDAAIRDSIGVLLRAHGFQSKTFASPSEFLDFTAPSENFCLVLDARLPGMSGLDLLDRLSQEGKSMPVIMITGHGDSTLVNEAKRRGVIECLKKPFKGDELIAAIELAISKIASP